ncbi:MAG TPA: carboxypeptidase-like regulatory domain-containing protein, partial [Flavisolibacter sp.]|nr:carboxypeptidase-like regulatory domain-containing protein [Flavisolibacter sp.]
MNRKLAFSLLLTLSWAFAWSQARQVSGRVLSDSAQQPVSGATVTLRGTGTSTSTNNEGRYTISVPSSGGTLIFSSIGFTTQNATVGNRSTIDVTLATSAGAALSDVVVVGYASVRRRDLTGSVSSVSQRQIKDVP